MIFSTAAAFYTKSVANFALFSLSNIKIKFEIMIPSKHVYNLLQIIQIINSANHSRMWTANLLNFLDYDAYCKHTEMKKIIGGYEL